MRGFGRQTHGLTLPLRFRKPGQVGERYVEPRFVVHDLCERVSSQLEAGAQDLVPAHQIIEGLSQSGVVDGAASTDRERLIVER